MIEFIVFDVLLTDIDGDGFLSIPEIEALFQKEVRKIVLALVLCDLYCVI